MLNPKTNERELAYVTRIEEIRPIPNYDRVEHARIGAGWWVIVKKDEFKVGDLCVYFEVDSKVPETDPFMFLESKHFKVKTLKMCKVLSQGLIIHPSEFKFERELIEGEFLTKELGITYAEAADNERKSSGVDKYKKMAQRRPNIFKKRWARWMMKREWGRRLMFLLFGKKRDKKSGWPAWVQKTDEERVQNCGWLFDGRDTGTWIMTEKIDGTSTTFTMKGKEFFVCSRNVVFDKPDKKCFYETNVYTEMAVKYNMEEVMHKWMQDMKEAGRPLEFLTIQGETYGAGIQKRDYEMKGHELAVFNVIYGYKNGRVERLNSYLMAGECELRGLKSVPILGDIKLPATCDEVLALAEAEQSKIDGGMREGIVFRSEDGVNSFKAVSNSFLLKYHS